MMNDFHVVAFMRSYEHWMNIIYAMAAMCIIYKLAIIARQVPAHINLSTDAFRFMCAIVGTIVTVKAYGRFHGGDAATWFDIARELSWCGFLAAAIVVMKQKFGNW
jgi:hypothetical protein